jgi:hypothetical protein
MTRPLIEMLNGATRGDCKSQIPVPVLEQALETAARIPGSDRSRGYCLKMICVDFLAGASGETGDATCLGTQNGNSGIQSFPCSKSRRKFRLT